MAVKGEGERHWLSSEELHAQQRKDDYEEEEQEEQADDGLHGIEQRHDEVTQRRPIPGKQTNGNDDNTMSFILMYDHYCITSDSLGDFEDPQ